MFATFEALDNSAMRDTKTTKSTSECAAMTSGENDTVLAVL
jgi:hypothetical protein